MPLDIRIRKATKKDFPAIRRLIRTYPDKLLQENLPRPSQFFVATLHSRMLGCCALEIYSKRLAEVRSLAVHADHQGKGIASMLIERCIAEAKKRRVYEILSITGAVTLFEKQGFGTFNNEKYALLKILG